MKMTIRRRYARLSSGSRSARARQLGALMLEVSLALLISALAAVGTIRETARTNLLKSAEGEAESLSIYRTALQNYVDNNYIQLQGNLPTVAVNGISLPDGDAAGQSRRPTIANLVGMGYLSPSFPAVLPSLNTGASYDNFIVNTPVGCVTFNCNVNGIAYVNRPYYVQGTEATTREVNGPVVGQMLDKLGAFGVVSVEGEVDNATGVAAGGSPSLFGLNGILLGVNPVAGAPAGVVGAQFGYNAKTNLNYVRIGETRDPALAGPLTVAGNTNLGANLSVAGTLAVAGATTLNNRLDVNGAEIRTTGDVRVLGNLIAGMTQTLGAVCANPGAIAQRSPSGTGMLICQGGSWKNLGLQASAGDACSNGSVATNASGLGLLCVNSVYRGMDTIIYTGVEGAVCPTNGFSAQTAAGLNLICKDNIYQSVSDLIGRQGIVSIDIFLHGQTVPLPTCGGSLQPRVIVLGTLAACSIGVGGSATCSNTTGSFQTSIDSDGVVGIYGSDGVTQAGSSAQATVASICSTV
jgi:hypothetical protein